uniref:Chymotrypsin-C-like n=1 Tax=Callorhinchus milii TaxID=7868 RepID=A0A4W3HUU9_CALMI
MQVVVDQLGAVWGLPFPQLYPYGSHHSTGRVVGGQEAVPHNWKWQVSLQSAYKTSPDYYGHFCGGTIYRRKWIMTAAHCFSSPEDYLYRVALGEHDIDEVEGTEYYLDVDAIFIHENWDPNYITKGFDIALLRLQSNVYDNSYIEIAVEPGNGEILAHGYSCYITGWGSTEHDGQFARELQQALLPVVDYATCSQSNWWSTAVNEQMICAGGDGYTAGCFGDSGGPLNCLSYDGYWTVYGIVSFGPGTCNQFQKPTVFTRVSAYQDWMEKVSSSSESFIES